MNASRNIKKGYPNQVVNPMYVRQFVHDGKKEIRKYVSIYSTENIVFSMRTIKRNSTSMPSHSS